MRRLALLATVSIAAASPAQADPRDWARASDWGRTGIVVGAFGAPAIEGDWHGAKQSLLAMGSATLLTGALKYGIHERRPDGSDTKSFPSGHTSISFAAAASIGASYGMAAGIPAHLVAGIVGLARVRADKHYWHDVVAGAVIGEVAGRLLVDRRHGHHAAPPLAMAMHWSF